MVDKVSGTVASFNTSFTFSFESKDYNESYPYCGDGMVFAFYPHYSISDQEYNHRGGGGGSFCALNFADPHERQFAVEIDSYYNMCVLNLSDFSDGHISVNFGNENLSSRYNLCDSTVDQCAIQYSLCEGTIVQTNYATKDSPYSQCSYFCKDIHANWNTHASGLIITAEDRHLRFGLESGHGSSKSSAISDYPVPPLSPGPSSSPGNPATATKVTRRKTISMAAGVCAAVVALIVVTLLYFGYIKYRKRGRRTIKNLELVSSLQASDTSRAFTFRELKYSTRDFSASELLSSGAFGDVYRGVLPSGAVVAVKRIRGNQEHGEESFLAEATSLRQIRHRNLLQLRGWCHTKEGLLLVYDFMCNGSLDKWIYRTYKSGDDSQRNAVKAVGLSLNVRRSILAGVASALDYLHEGGRNAFCTATSNPATCCWTRISMRTWATWSLPV